MEFSVATDLRDKFRHALEEQDSRTTPFFTCPLCEKCPVCSVSASSRRHQKQSELSLSMPDNWTSSFTSPRRKGQTQAARTLLRADSTQSLTPQENSKTMRLRGSLEEQQQTIEQLRGVIEDHKAELNLMVNKLQYANVEMKQWKGKVYQRDKEVTTLTARVRELEGLLQQSRSQESAVEKSLALSESCRSNTARELARWRRKAASAGATGAATGSLSKSKPLTSASGACSASSMYRKNQSHRSPAPGKRRVGGSNTHHSITYDDDDDDNDDDDRGGYEYLDISNNQEVMIKADLTTLMKQILEWNTNGILPEMRGNNDWLEHIYTQLHAMSTKI